VIKPVRHSIPERMPQRPFWDGQFRSVVRRFPASPENVYVVCALMRVRVFSLRDPSPYQRLERAGEQEVPACSPSPSTRHGTRLLLRKVSMPQVLSSGQQGCSHRAARWQTRESLLLLATETGVNMAGLRLHRQPLPFWGESWVAESRWTPAPHTGRSHAAVR
jgi:hypothetical protein